MTTRSAAFRAIVHAVVPEAGQLDDAGWRAVAAIIEHALAQRPRSMQRQLAIFVRVLDVLSLLRHGRPLARLDPRTRVTFLGKIQDSRLLLVRRGFWGLRTLALMGYYARPEAMPVIGYRAQVRGWQARSV